VAWKLALDPQGGNDNTLATGVEEGAAGIGWTYLQAYEQTGNKDYLNKATYAGNWLLSVAIKKPNGGLAWREDEHSSNTLVRPNLDNGAAGIGMFLHDLAKASGNNKYQTAAEGAVKGLVSSASHSGNNVYWQDNDEGNLFKNDPSWHWGLAGYIEAIQRINGGQQDIIGEQPSLPTSRQG
jgi:lantibiotic modifying enzyme